ncbi:MAG: RluA family pseudouridine synthase [Clostridia bacterium]|nr:RluA family pseudouridine synthase [Clostridia bacterium]
MDKKTITYKDLNIVFEDNHLLVVVKPVDVPCQADESGDPDMLTLLKQYLVEKYNKPGDAYLGLVHRLDRPTGGVMVFAKTSKAASRLSEAIKNGEVDKKYFAILEGVPRYKADKLTCYLKKFPDTNTVKVVPALSEGAKYAELDYKVLNTKTVEGKGDFALVSVNLVTGRGHQIRVQMQNMGTPILGDKRYGTGRFPSLPLCLWATELRFAHPVGGQELVFRVYPPEEAGWNLFDYTPYLAVAIKNAY